MSRRALLAAAALAGLLAAPALRANDSSAEKAAGGLVLRQNRDIDMVSEDLFISPAQVRVHYVFRNSSARPVTVTVAFPMPDRDLGYEFESEVAYPENFHTLVDGHPVRMRVERKAMVHGVDQSALLAGLHIPLMPTATVDVAGIATQIGHLPRATQDRLARLGLIDRESLADPSRQIIPAWTVKETFYWDQLFPAGRDLRVEHSYRPGVGGTAGVPLSNLDYRQGENGRQEQREFCTDAPFLAALDRVTARQDSHGPIIIEQRLRYILVTGGNWRAPIGDFHLTIDKGRPDAITSFCADGVQRTGPTRFEVRHRNWRPDHDLAILIVGPAPSD